MLAYFSFTKTGRLAALCRSNFRRLALHWRFTVILLFLAILLSNIPTMGQTYIVDFEPPEKEKERLNLQHRAVMDNIGHYLPPIITDRDRFTAIADVATGTGIWLQELAREFPSNVTFDGYDITDRLFPDSSELPENVKFSCFSVYDPVPEHLYEKYDVVHIRGLCMVLRANEWDGVLKNISKMLKPGGYFIWTETDPASSRAIPPRPNAAIGAGLLEFMCKIRGGDPYITKSLPDLFKTNDNFTILKPASDDDSSNPTDPYYVNIPGDKFKPHTLRPFSQNFVRGLCSVIAFMAQHDVPNEWFTPETSTEFANKFVADTEGEDGSCVVFDLCCLVAQKKKK